MQANIIGIAVTAALLALAGARGAIANSFTPPLQLHPCVAAGGRGAASQLWSFGRNGSNLSKYATSQHTVLVRVHIL